ncbi:anthranilate phosphoribosyltransferase [Aestuariibacter halophilus]|uniref:Anthranilate phosphoribosyltransferase n=1 Tax=Fluctibacter halophilus TaxID=226011 RepID=A0ABS8G3U9_9ALTE|nr:anthranilate phosphoribosyltransferase [Aestuariibacter halophilus]MCC2615262.1 anthranilate phosphoribosyltransferase [Aestuariibacter halophilus]
MSDTHTGDINSALETLFSGHALSQSTTQALFGDVVKGNMSDIHLSALLTALKLRGESADDIAGAAQALIDAATPFPTPDYPFADIVGTGGDGHDTINISSAAAIVAAACGIKVAKHGNRSVSSRSGSADLYASFGIKLDMTPQTARRCLDESNLCFLFAPVYHAGIKHAMNVRTTLKTRTLFNLLGPLVNPAHPSHMMIGVYSPDLLQPFADTLQRLGYQRAMVVHGAGLDELALHGDSACIEIRDDQQYHYTLSAADFGVDPAPLTAIKGGDPAHNQQLISAVLSGKGEAAHRDAVAINAGALLYLCGAAQNVADGTRKALDVINSGAALATIHRSAALSQEA